ncbi:hypothetical protein EXIGLDRAFT_609571 [Exidia glandulosa HHB12029]|uniref:Inositol-pentakisphosphate 2-kinase n=1 Tax=Exidia glandulosa HHB12029 TaxID=1314781 RepID=A0A165KDN7_EXIGL|nr:hypothetical protein EXIGLDRAFT_609571 [Exidia glandulosa HHB12029]
MVVADATQTLPTDWQYVAEGGASTVLAYIGAEHAGFDGKVLMLRKRPLDILSPPLHGDLSLDLADKTVAEEDDDFAVAFQRRVTGRLVPEHLLPELGAAHVSTNWLKDVAAAIDATRPASRRAKDSLDLDRTKGVLATNLVGARGLVVEIKPKWGFIPSTTHLSEETREVKAQHCRFCIHAHFKQLQGEIVAEGFCPLDLYSGDGERVDKAMDSLWRTWSTAEDGNIHNMRVFLDGITMDPRDPEAIKKVQDWLLALDGSATDAREVFKAAVTDRLAKSSVLPVLSQLQRTLDPLDVEGLAKLAAEADLPMGTDEITLDDWADFVVQHLGAAREYDHAHPDVSHIHYYRLAYILSASFKDCSVIINLDEATHHPVTLIDLDPKSPKKLGKWEELDRTIVKAFRGVEHPQCIDALSRAG